MKIIITEKQAEKLFNQKVVCKKCNHSWKIEKNDKLPFLCHMCGWNQELKKYQDDELLKFWRKELN